MSTTSDAAEEDNLNLPPEETTEDDESEDSTSIEMEENSQQIEITIMPAVEIDKVAASLENMESLIFDDLVCSIYKVPDNIQKGKEEYYRPFYTSIGPVFYDDPKLEAMQELKLIFMKSFRLHPDNACQSYEPYINFARNNEREIRECYQHQITLSSDEFIQLIVLNAAFLIYSFMILSDDIDYPPVNNTPIPAIGKKFLLTLQNMSRDLFQEENQLPFFVLKNIYNIAFNAVNPCYSFTDLALEFIGSVSSSTILSQEAIKSIIAGKKITDESSVQHLVDLHIMCCCLPYNDDIKGQQELVGEDLEKQKQICFHKFEPAKILRSAGVKFESIQSDNPFAITFNKTNGVLTIPKLTLYDETESIMRSMLFFEQCHYTVERRYFTDYMIFLDTLIDTVDDIQVLQKTGILHNYLGSDEDARDLFNNLAKNTFYDSAEFVFSNVSKDLKDYASSRRNKWKAILWGVYFKHPWAIISVIYAIILLILTLLQTITGFLQIDN